LQGKAPVAQWIEQRFPKPRAVVRSGPGALPGSGISGVAASAAARLVDRRAPSTSSFEIFLIGGVTALIGAALSLVLIRARDLQLYSDEESAGWTEPDADSLSEQPALAA
jgi:hypothetical protein